jgi:hypothetical protein
MKMTQNIIIGIDPDLIKSGVAICYKDAQLYKHILEISLMSLPELYDYLKYEKPRISGVFVEAGWLNRKSNYHSHSAQSKIVGERIARNVGENHATGKIIVQFCEHLELNTVLVRPAASKLTAQEFKELTYYQHKTNQDMRDAGIVAWSNRRMGF